MKRNLLFISRYPEIIDEFQGILEEKQIETEIAQNGTDAMNLINNSVLCVGEISNMGCTPEAIDAHHKAGTLTESES